MIKLKIGGGNKASSSDATPASQNAASTTPASASGPAPPVKLKLNLSQPPTPIEQPNQVPFPGPTNEPVEKKKRAYQRKQDGPGRGKKRTADEDSLPLAKRIASGPTRKFSLKLGPQTSQTAEDGAKAPPKLQLGKRKQSVPKFVELRARGKAPPRPKGVGYDSEDSDVETDPAIQQAFVLRMQEGEDADYLRHAIAEGKIGTHISQGDADVSLKFIEKNYRRAVVKIHGRMYAAVLVDLPCVVESMKSFDRKGWWKVADIGQMLLVLGRCSSEDEAKSYALPREVNKNNYQYAHGLTPPMHWVRKRRFRKRLNYNDVINVEEEVERLLEADKLWEATGGTVSNDSQDRTRAGQSLEPQEYSVDEDAEGEAIETVEMDGQEYDEDEMDEDAPDDDLEAQMQAMFDAEDADGSGLVAESPAPMAGHTTSKVDDSEATPVGTPADTTGMTPQQYDQSSDEDESDEDDDDEDSPDAFDEDAAAKAAERAQQLEEVQDLEREVERARQKAQAMTNQLLRQREMAKLSALEEDLRVKRGVFGLSNDED